MSADASSVSVPNLGITKSSDNPAVAFIGGLLIEIFIACILYGITTLQSFMYFQKYPNDALSLKLLVGAVWALETVHTAFCMQFLYAYLVEGFGDFAYFLQINWGIGVTVITSAGIALCVQGYYVWRVWCVSSKSLFWTVVIGVFALARVAFGIGSTILSYVYPEWLLFRDTKSSLVTISGGLGSAALVDMLVALTLSYYLNKGRSSWHKESNSKINMILLYAVNTGAITGTASLLCVILFATQKQSLVFLGLVEIQAKLYANSFLGSLNARSHIRNKNNPAAQYPSFEFSSSGNGFRAVVPPTVPVPKVEVYQQTIVHDDRGLSNESAYDMRNLKGGELV
ncbi:hypothetical protein C8Q70DRAFT_514348 [Cubamyces menziesii]|uniref:DUF6534 domain-containing protein n=1 Tax=Trametes cubensis TaxID=1111947 RepID=A0AAD7TTY2_9APHY|nr:hypothetical protein C8Q70DRAFT_514348 [Cubamyces menziesii]KAJ8481378.1 hypothetical protein ONZ51_g6022 [Trametes cubensis]